jgi:hypothetical protein
MRWNTHGFEKRAGVSDGRVSFFGGKRERDFT